MAVDIRASVTCSLGRLISATISDDYIQGTGLVKCKGSCEISGLISPAIGTPVTFSYTKGGVVRTVPRKLRVLSSFADPFRRTTKVELGCKLTYMQDVIDPDGQLEIVNPTAQGIYNRCLSALGLSDQGPFGTGRRLSNVFFRSSFDVSAGWVTVLSDLLVSENLCGYLDQNEVLRLIDLQESGGTGPVFQQSELIDIGPIGVGQIPAEVIRVSYRKRGIRNIETETPQQQAPLTQQGPGWTTSRSSTPVSSPYKYFDQNGNEQTAVYRGVESTEERTSYRKIGSKNVVASRTIKVRKPASAVLGSLVAQALNAGLSFSDYTVESEVTETFTYDANGNETFRRSRTNQDIAFLAGSLNVNFVFDNSGSSQLVTPSGRYDEGITEVDSVVGGSFKKTIERIYGPWAKTISGQQAVSESRNAFENGSSLLSFIRQLASGQHLIGSSARSERTTATAQEAPSDIQDALNELGIEGSLETELLQDTTDSIVAYGNGNAERSLTLNIPYVSDDIVTTTTSQYGVVPQVQESFPIFARSYGLIQNKMLLGNRSGMNVQLAPERLPAAPFAPVFINASTLTAAYRLNGTSWTMDANGILVSTDAMYWGVAGKNA